MEKFAQGEAVNVMSGPFTNFAGKVAEVNPDRPYLRVIVDVFGVPTAVELKFSEVRKVPANEDDRNAH